ncbi:hypothetical protein J6590_049325 [Homalodisca vitripennis]|nr:hypothetical protein J6590_049325 [Homalodisca vitripennis]
MKKFPATQLIVFYRSSDPGSVHLAIVAQEEHNVEELHINIHSLGKSCEKRDNSAGSDFYNRLTSHRSDMDKLKLTSTTDPTRWGNFI